jgi:hypothetical protein
MALTINSTLAQETSNSYCDQAFADDYWANHYDSIKAAQWDALDDAPKQQVLIRACQVLETARYTIPVTLPEYAMHYDRHTGLVLSLNLTRQPVKYYYYQRLQFPRNLDVYYMNPPSGKVVGDQYIPEPVLIAQCEQSLYMLNIDETAMANRLQGITMDKVGLGKQQIESTQEYSVSGSMFAPLAYEMMSPLMVRGGKLQRG